MSQLALSQVCQQKKTREQNNIPPVRFTVTSPYDGTYTSKDLNMRRKIEILKYQNNNGKQTQNSQFSSINQNALLSISRRVPSNDCYKDPQKNKSSSANIPGKSMQFVYNENVPLYNLYRRTESLAIQPSVNDYYFKLHTIQGSSTTFPFQIINQEGNDVIHSMTSPVQFGYLQFYDNIPNALSTLRIIITFQVITDRNSIIIEPIANNVNDLEIFFSDTELIEKKTINTQFSSSRIEKTSSNVNPTFVCTTDIIEIPSQTGYIYTLKYFFENFIVSRDVDIDTNRKPFSLKIVNIKMVDTL